MTPQLHTEIEVKYDAGPHVVLPDLLGVDGVAALETPGPVDLDAVYFDTADLRLLRAGTTLRRRTGGADEGWHLKLPKVDDARIEVQRPLGLPGKVPAQLRQLTRAHARNQPLAPVATLHTRRVLTRLLDNDGAVLAEVCDDAVLGVRHGEVDNEVRWREWEIELVDGERPLLAAVGQRLLAAGASPAGSASKLARVLQPAAAPPRPRPSSSAGAALTGLLRQQNAVLLAWDPPLRIDAPTAVHTMRTTIRALRGLLSTYRPLLHAELSDPVHAELRWLGQLLAAIRDTDVVAHRLQTLLDAEPAALVSGPARDQITATTRRRRDAARAELLAALDGQRYFQLLDTLYELTAAPPLRAAAARRPVAVVQRRLSRRLWRRVLTRAQAAQDAPSEELLHDVRKAARRTVQTLLDTPAAPASLVRKMTRLQDALGVVRDTVLTRDAVVPMARAAADRGEDTFSLGRLHALEQACAGAADAEYRSALSDVRGTTSRWLGLKA